MEILDFWAIWCPPCKAIAPVIEKLAEKHQIKLTKINADTEEARCAEYDIRNLPTVILLKDGKEHTRIVGAQSETHFEAAILKLKEA